MLEIMSVYINSKNKNKKKKVVYKLVVHCGFTFSTS